MEKEIIFTVLLMPIIFGIGYMDYKKRIIPNRLILLAFYLTIVQIIYFIYKNDMHEILARIAGFGVPTVFLLIVYFINPKLSGGGDLKLIGVMGLFLGIYNLIAIMLLNVIFSIIYYIARKDKYVPLGTITSLSFAIYTIIKIKFM